MIKRNGLELTASIVALVLTAVALVLFCLSYTTGYYIFGQMQSGLIALLLASSLVVGLLSVIFRAKFPGALWPKFLIFVVVGALAGAAALLLGDRVEGIGNCIVTDYDSGHGGEEAIYASLAACILMLIAIVYCVIGSFAKDKTETPAKKRVTVRSVGFGVSAVAVLLAVLVPTYRLAFPGGPVSGPGGQGTSGGVYTVSYGQGNNNAEDLPDYQFLAGDLSFIAKVDGRLYIDITLTLDGNGGYTLFSDCYSIESGVRTQIGDSTGMGQVMTMNAEGTYEENADGTVTTSVPTHAVYEMRTDTYSGQMKDAAGLEVNGSKEDGIYDSNEEPAVLDFVPKTIWTLKDGAILSYRSYNYTVTYSQADDNLDDMPDYQFLCSDLSSLLKADSRMYVDVTLTLDGGSGYTLLVDAYIIESGVRAEVGDATGLGLVLTMSAEGTYTTDSDGTVTTSVPSHAVFEMQTDTYSSQMKDAIHMEVNGNNADGVYDSAEEPAVLDFVPETVWTFDGAKIDTYERVDDEAGGEEQLPAVESLTVASDDGSTTFTFNADGTAKFEFAAYGVEDTATWSYEDGILTVINANGAEVTASGDPLKFRYVTSLSDELTGDFTVNAAELETVRAGGGENPGGKNPSGEEPGSGLTVASDDGSTTMTFNPDGTYVFAFADYGIEDAGTYTYADGVLTITDTNGQETVVEGDPLKLHYVASMSDQLTGDFTIPAADLTTLLSGDASTGDGLTVTSDDGSTTMTFNPDGTYVFAFADYGIEDAGTYTYADGVLTITDTNGQETVVEGDPLKLHYVASMSDQLTGDFTVAAADMP